MQSRSIYAVVYVALMIISVEVLDAQPGDKLTDYNSTTKEINLIDQPYYKLSQFIYPSLRIIGTGSATKSRYAIFEISDSRVDSIQVYGDLDLARFMHVSGDLLRVNDENQSDSRIYLQIVDSSAFQSINILSCTLQLKTRDLLLLTDAVIKDCTINEESNLHFIPQNNPVQLRLQNVQLKSRLRLEVARPQRNSVRLIVDRTDIDMIDLDYFAFKLTFDSALAISFDEQKATFNELLASFRKRGKEDSFEKLDKEYKEWKYKLNNNLWGAIINWIDWFWWDYGYNKFLVFRSAVILNFVFFIINLFVYPILIKDVYVLSQFSEAYQYFSADKKKTFLKYSKNIVYIFLYTSYIFWGWKLEISNIRIHRVVWFGYVLLQYLVGLICIAYIANIVITV